jgi:hypothetical protein
VSKAYHANCGCEILQGVRFEGEKIPMRSSERLVSLLPDPMRNRLATYLDALGVFVQIRDPRVLIALGPSGVRGLVLQLGRSHDQIGMKASHKAHFDWTYPHDFPEMRKLYARAKELQWDAETYLKWQTSVDPMNPEVPLLPPTFLDFKKLESLGCKLNAHEQRDILYRTASWMLSQFLHGEQGALFAAAQVTEAVEWFDGKLFGASQVMDEGRHVEAFHRYIDEKLNKLYRINDNLYVLIDSLMTDSRWDMKFLGMQIMVEGLALGAFSTFYKQTKEPLLRELLKMVIRDEARHVHYGVLALKEYFAKALTESQRREREEWAFEVALLMRNRFMVWEIYEEQFAHKLTRAQWVDFVQTSPGMNEFRRVMFSRLVPNLREIGLMSDKITARYEKAGLLQYIGGVAANKLSGEQMVAELDMSPVAAE